MSTKLWNYHRAPHIIIIGGKQTNKAKSSVGDKVLTVVIASCSISGLLSVVHRNSLFMVK